MKLRFFGNAFLLALLFVPAFGQEPELALREGVKAHNDIDRIYQTFSDAYSKLDAGLASSLYAEKTLYLQPDAEIIKGRKAMHQIFETYFDSARTNRKQLAITFEIIERGISADLAYDIGTFRLTTSNRDSVEHTGRGKFFVIMLRDEKGAWRFQVNGYSDIKK